jgi:hypothetical protein
MAVVPLSKVWIDANFRETQLADLRVGQTVTISSDIYGGKTVFHGKVLGLGAGSGNAFALLPPQNASGNWIKIVQRVPVRIALDPAELSRHPFGSACRCRSAWIPAIMTAPLSPQLPQAPSPARPRRMAGPRSSARSPPSSRPTGERDGEPGGR